MEILKIDMEFLSSRPLSYSALKAFRQSPKHYQMYLQQPRVTTDAMLNGSVVDCLLLTPELFESKFMVKDKPDLRTNAGKESWKQALDLVTEKKMTLISTALLENAKYQVAAVMEHPIAGKIIEAKTRTQIRLKWTHKETKIPMIGYVDLESNAWESDLVVELKTANSSDPDRFIKDAATMDYFIQTGAYMDGYPRCFFKFPNMAYVVVENAPPYNVSVFFCDPKYLSRSADEFHGSMNAFKYCMDHGLWNMGYDFRLMGTREYFTMELPAYLKQKYITIKQEDL